MQEQDAALLDHFTLCLAAIDRRVLSLTHSQCVDIQESTPDVVKLPVCAISNCSYVADVP